MGLDVWPYKLLFLGAVAAWRNGAQHAGARRRKPSSREGEGAALVAQRAPSTVLRSWRCRGGSSPAGNVPSHGADLGRSPGTRVKVSRGPCCGQSPHSWDVT